MTGEPRQFDAGSPVDLPDRSFPTSGLDPDHAVTANVLVDARFASGAEGFVFPYRFDLALDRHED